MHDEQCIRSCVVVHYGIEVAWWPQVLWTQKARHKMFVASCMTALKSFALSWSDEHYFFGEIWKLNVKLWNIAPLSLTYIYLHLSHSKQMIWTYVCVCVCVCYVLSVILFKSWLESIKSKRLRVSLASSCGPHKSKTHCWSLGGVVKGSCKSGNCSSERGPEFRVGSKAFSVIFAQNDNI